MAEPPYTHELTENPVSYFKQRRRHPAVCA